jgi:polyisoprenoid-binding protein YceI
MRTSLVLLALLAAGPAAAQSLTVPSGTYKVDPTHASVVWKVSHFGYSTYTGFLDRAAIDATVELDAADVAKSTLAVDIDGAKIVTLHPVAKDPRGVDFDAEIVSDKFLNTAANPAVTFRTTGITVTGENTADVTGELTLNGQTHPLTLAATLNKAADQPMTGKPVLGISATGVVKRSQYGVTYLAGPVGDEVTLEIQAEFVHEG